MRVINHKYRKAVRVMQKMICSTLCVFLAFVLFACGGAPEAETSVDAPTNTPAPIVTPEPPTATTALQANTPVPPTETTASVAADTTTPTDTPMPVPVDTPVPTDTPLPPSTPEPLFYNLPPATLTSATGLYASPNRAELIVPVPVPAGEIVYVMGKNATGSHLRVVWSTGVGWLPVSFTDYNGRRDKLSPLPIFTREPPACAVPITTQFGLNSNWTSETKQRIAVIADLFRSRYGDFPLSHLSLTVNGQEVESSRRQIVEQGQFSLKDIVFTLPADVQPGDTVGYLLDTSSDEPLTFMATIFSVPSNCKWELD